MSLHSTHPCELHTREKSPESSTVMQAKYLKYKVYKHYLITQKFSSHKYEENKTVTNFLGQI